MWDLIKDLEIESFDTDTTAIPIQDSLGKTYIANKDYIINTEMGCKIKSYMIDTNKLNEKNSMHDTNFKF